MKAKNNNIIRSKRILLAALMAGGFLGVLFVNSQAVWAKDITAENVIELVNKERKSRNLEILRENIQLFEAAREKSEDMIANNYFAHTSPKGITPWYWIEKNGYDYIYAGENLAINFSSSEEQHKAWMESLEHRKNIINPHYKEIGVAVKRGGINGKEAVITVQVFGARKSSAVTPPPKIINGAKSESGGLAYKTVEFNVNNNNKFEKIIAQTEDGKKRSERMVIVAGNLNGSRDVLGGAAWIVLLIILAFSVILNVTIVANSSRRHYGYLTKF